MAFNPNDHLRNLKGAQYLDVRWRVMWLREEHPDAVIKTELAQLDLDQDLAIFRAEVTIPGQGSATGYGSETKQDFPQGWVEKAECLELGAEVLTRDGFKSYDQLTIGEDVLAYSVDDDRCHWVPLQAITVHDARPTIRLYSPWFEAIMTPDHSWATTGTHPSHVTGRRPRRLRPASALTSADRLTLAAPAPGGTADLTPDEAAMLGWLFTDGSVWDAPGRLDANIYQSKPERVGQIRDLVGALARESVGQPTRRVFPTGNGYDCLPQHVFHVPAAYLRPLLERAGLESSQDLPALVTRLSEPARWAMLDAMMAADGDEKGRFGKKRKPGVMEAWQILCTLQGQAVGARRNEDVFPVQRAKARRFLSCSQLHREDAGVRPVWCPTTPLGTWVCRLPSGQVTITGNTKAIGRAVAALGFGTQFALELDDGERLADTPAARPATSQTARPAPAPTTAGAATATRPTDDMAREAAALKEEIKRLRPDLATPNGGYLLATLAKEMGRMVPATPADITIGYLRTLRDDIKARTAHAGSATATTTATDEPPLVERFLARLHEADQAHDQAAIDKVAQDAVMTHKTGALSDGEYDRVAEALDALRVTDDADTTHQSELVEALPF